MKLLQSRTPVFVQRPTEDEEEERQEERADKRPVEKEGPARLAFVAELERTALQEGSDAGVWFQAIGGGFSVTDAGEIPVDRRLLVRLAGVADLAVLLHPDVEELRAAAVELAELTTAHKAARPLLFAGPFSPGDVREMNRLAGLVDGVVVRAQDREEAVLEAEELRRAASTLGEVLLLEGGGWKAMPAVCLSAPPDVLAIVSPSAVEWCLLTSPPGQRAIPGGTLIVCDLPEWRPFWAGFCGAVGPARLEWRSWLRDPRRRWTG